MRITGALPLAGLLVLAGCNSEPEVDVQDASAEEVAREIADSGGSEAFVSPGQWQSTVTLQEMTVPGMPPEAARQMQAAMNRTEVTESCLTPEEAQRPKEDFFAGAQKGCTYKRFTMAGGKIDAEMTCQEGGASMTMALDGTYSADSYKATMTMNGSNPTGGPGMTMRLAVDAKRIGECKAG